MHILCVEDSLTDFISFHTLCVYVLIATQAVVYTHHRYNKNTKTVKCLTSGVYMTCQEGAAEPAADPVPAEQSSAQEVASLASSVVLDLNESQPSLVNQSEGGDKVGTEAERCSSMFSTLMWLAM